MMSSIYFSSSFHSRRKFNLKTLLPWKIRRKVKNSPQSLKWIFINNIVSITNIKINLEVNPIKKTTLLTFIHPNNSNQNLRNHKLCSLFLSKRSIMNLNLNFSHCKYRWLIPSWKVVFIVFQLRVLKLNSRCTHTVRRFIILAVIIIHQLRH